MMSGSWGHCQSGVCSLTLDSGDDFRGGVEMVVTMFTVIRGRIDSYAGLELSCSLVGVRVG